MSFQSMNESKQISLLTFLKTYVQVLLIRRLNEMSLLLIYVLFFKLIMRGKLILLFYLLNQKSVLITYLRSLMDSFSTIYWLILCDGGIKITFAY